MIKVSGKDITTAARESGKLNENLKAVIETVKGSGRSFKSINTALESMSNSMKTINSSMSANKIKTKGLETYQKRMQEVNKTLDMVNKTASSAAKSLKSVNDSTTGAAGMQSLEKILNQVVIGLDRIEERIRVSNIQLEAMEENTGKTAKRLKTTRDATQASAEAMNEYSKSVGRATQSQDGFNNSARGLAGSGRNQKRAFSELAFSMNPLTSAYASIAINVYAVSEAFRVLNEAANFDRLMTQTASFSAAVSGINVKGLARDMSELSQGALSVRESMSFATKGAAFNFTAEQLENLTVGARKASIALGRDFNDSMDRVLRGISKQEIELFDELGVVTRLTPAFEAYAKTVDKTVDELSDYERQLALTNEVQRQLDTRFSGIDAQATKWEELGVAAKNAIDNMLVGLSSLLAPLASATTSLLSMINQTNAYKAATDDVVESQKTLESALEGEHWGQALVALSSLSKANKELVADTTDTAESVEAAAERTENLATALTVASTALSLYTARTIATIVPLNAMTAATKSAVAWLAITNTQLRAIGFSKVGAALTAAASGMWVLTKSVRAATAAMITNPLFLIVAGASLAAIYAFQDEIGELADSILELIPGIDSSSQALGRQKVATDAATTSLRDYYKVLGEAGIAVSSFSDDEIAEMGAAIIAFNRDFEIAARDMESLANSSKQVSGPISEFVKTAMSLREANIPTVIQGIGVVTAKTREEFEKISKSLGLDATINSFDELYEYAERLNEKVRDLSVTLSAAALDNTLQGNSQLQGLESQLDIQKNLLDFMDKADKKNVEAMREKRNEIYLLEKQIEYQKQLEKINQVKLNNTLAANRFESAGLGVYRDKYELIQQELDAEDKLLATMGALSSTQTEALILQQSKVDLLKDEVRYYKDLAKAQAALRQAEADSSINSIMDNTARNRESLGNRRLNEETEAARASAQATLDLNVARAKLREAQVSGADPQQLQVLSAEVMAADAAERIALAKEEAAAYREIGSAISEVAGSVPGLTSLQNEFIAMSGTIADTMTNVTELVASGQELALSDFSDSIIAVGTMASSLFSEMTQGIITDIDNQIAAEKKRDGKSQESLAKIRALEKKKIKEKEKSSIAQTAMSTSLAIMKTMAEVPFPANIAMSAAIGAMGLMQVNNIKKASAGQLAALDADTGGLSLSVGSRNNAVDTSMGASMGELSYLRGESGFGTGANNFTPGRSGGGSITVGERGAEQIVPTQPLYVKPASESETESKPVTKNNLNLNITALDSQSIVDRSDDIWEALERAANSKGFTLASLEA